jgi:hypothetical protein
MKKIILIALAIGMLTSCGNPKPKELNVVDAVRFPPPVVKADAEVMAKMADPAPAEQPITDTAKKIIKTGDISFETDNVNATRKKILTSLKKLGGYVAEDNETHDDDSDRQEYTLKLRLPAKNFGLLLDSVSSTAARIDSKNISIKDVTSQFIDIKAQLANSHVLENTYLGLLKKADKMGDVLQIENKITDIRTAIDSTQGALNYLSRQVAYSSLDVTFYTKYTAVENSNTIGARFRDAIANGCGTLQNLFFGLISLWPLILIIAFFYLLVRKWWRKRRLRKQVALA